MWSLLLLWWLRWLWLRCGENTLDVEDPDPKHMLAIFTGILFFKLVVQMRSECLCVRLSLRSNVIYDMPPPIGYLLFLCTHILRTRGCTQIEKVKKEIESWSSFCPASYSCPHGWGGVCVSVYRTDSPSLTACSRRRRVPPQRFGEGSFPLFPFFLSSRLPLAHVLLLSRLLTWVLASFCSPLAKKEVRDKTTDTDGRVGKKASTAKQRPLPCSLRSSHSLFSLFFRSWVTQMWPAGSRRASFGISI